ncbi:MAG: hypothetical protein ACRC33_17295 [Gemmataceae bacterium]
MLSSRVIAVRLAGVVSSASAGAFAGLAYATRSVEQALVGTALIGAGCAAAVAVVWMVAELFRRAPRRA